MSGISEHANVLSLDAGPAHQIHAREGESWSWRWPARVTTLHEILLEVENDDRFREILDALRQAGFALTERDM